MAVVVDVVVTVVVDNTVVVVALIDMTADVDNGHDCAINMASLI